MAVYTRVARDDLEAFLQDYDLGEVIAFHGIADGTVNTNFYLTTSHRKTVLTLFEQLSMEDLPYFLDFMSWLSEHDIPCAHPISGVDGINLRRLKGKPASLFERLDGEWIANPDTKACRQIGRTLARMHRAGAGFVSRRANPFGRAWCREQGRVLLEQLPAREAELLRQELTFQGLEQHHDLPRGAIHGDLFRDNALFRGGILSGVIDFYFACDEVFLFDLAIAANDWCSDPEGHLDDARARAMLSAYDDERPFTSKERSAWPAMLRAAALRWWLSLLTEARAPRSGEITRIKAPEEFERILRDRIAHYDRLQQLILME